MTFRAPLVCLWQCPRDVGGKRRCHHVVPVGTIGRRRTERFRRDLVGSTGGFPTNLHEDRNSVYSRRKQERFDNRSWFGAAVKEAEIPRIIWHGLRHAFCSWLAMAGATTREIMEATVRKTMSQAASYKQFLYKSFIFLVPGGGFRTPTRLPSADFESIFPRFAQCRKD